MADELPSATGLGARSVDGHLRLRAIDSLHRALFDRASRNTHLAEFASLFGADFIALLRRALKGPIAIMDAWSAASCSLDLSTALSDDAVWRRAHRLARRPNQLVVAGRPAIRLLVNAQATDRCVLLLCRPAGSGPFSDEAMTVLRSLDQTIAKAISLRARIDQSIEHARSSLAILDAVNLPLAIVDGHGDVLVANAAARAIVENQGILMIERRRLLATNEPDSNALSIALAAGTNQQRPRPSVVSLSSPGNNATLRIHVMPLESSSLRQLPMNVEMRLALLSFDVVRPLIGGPKAGTEIEPRQQDLTAKYGLTIAERRVLALIMAGQKPASIALALGVSLLTVRAQIRSLYDKTGRRGIPALIALFQGLA